MTDPANDKKTGGEAPHIHVDESWKERARREKEQLSKGQTPDESEIKPSAAEPAASQSEGQAAKGEAPAGPGGSPSGSPQDEMGQLPPADFLMFVSGLATQAMIHLGAFPDTATGKPAEDLDHAKYMIDLLDMLQEKTKGNLDTREAETLKAILYDLRMAYVQKTR